MEILTVDEAAQMLHKTPGTIRAWILKDKIKARKISAGGNGVFVILRTDLLEFVLSESFQHPTRSQKSVRKTKDLQVRLPV